MLSNTKKLRKRKKKEKYKYDKIYDMIKNDKDK